MCFNKFKNFKPWIVLIELRGTLFNRRINLLRGLGRFKRELALIGFRTTGGWILQVEWGGSLHNKSVPTVTTVKLVPRVSGEQFLLYSSLLLFVATRSLFVPG